MATRSLLGESHRRAVAARLSEIDEQIRNVRAEIGDLKELAELSRAVEDARKATGAQPRRQPPNVLGAALALMFVMVEELRPRNLAGYGQLDPEAAELLDSQARTLEERVSTLATRLSATEV